MALRAWGKALIKTGTEHLDLEMVLQGKKTLKEAEELEKNIRNKA